MNIFNRREIYVTMDLQQLNQIVGILDKENIKYSYKVINTSGVKAGTVQSIGLNSNCMFLYYIYVHNKNYEKACWVIGGMKLF